MPKIERHAAAAAASRHKEGLVGWTALALAACMDLRTTTTS